MSTRPVRRLQRAHFAFMRALLQGLDERESWNRYLRANGEVGDLRAIRHTIAWIRDEFAAAAQREARPGIARLVRLDPERLVPALALPTLEDFATQRGMEDFSEAEQALAYAETYPQAAVVPGARRGARPTKRARLISRQLEALRWLEAHVSNAPMPTDSVRAWLNGAVADRLHDAGWTTLSELVARINSEGARWWRHVPGVGSVKASRVVAWLRAQEDQTGLRIERHVLLPRTKVPAAILDQVVPAAAALVPWEKFRLPAAFAGGDGVFRAPLGDCVLGEANDAEALDAWLRSKAATAARGRPSATGRAYRKEVERLLLWSVLVRRKPVSSLSADDAIAYLAFLGAPPPHWCGPRHRQRWSPQWRPIEGPVSGAGQAYCVRVLRSLFDFLIAQRYVTANPFSTTVAQVASRSAAPGRTGAMPTARA